MNNELLKELVYNKRTISNFKDIEVSDETIKKIYDLTSHGATAFNAAHLLGLDTGAMSGFDNAGVDREFFAGTEIKSNFLINLGYGDYEKVLPRLPRLDFNEASKIL